MSVNDQIIKKVGLGLTDVSLIRSRGEARKMLNVFDRRPGPVVDDNEGQQKTTEGIEPPNTAVEAD